MDLLPTREGGMDLLPTREGGMDLLPEQGTVEWQGTVE